MPSLQIYMICPARDVLESHVDREEEGTDWGREEGNAPDEKEGQNHQSPKYLQVRVFKPIFTQGNC